MGECKNPMKMFVSVIEIGVVNQIIYGE